MGFDEKAYWRKRHVDMTGKLTAVGIDNLRERTNERSYRLVAEQYERVLDRLALPTGTRVIDAGAGIGFFSRILMARGYEVTAVDISQVALDEIEGVAAKVCSPLATAPIPARSAELVHSFDVVYHIMEDREWKASLEALARWSSKYIVMHERFLRLPQLVPSRIMKMRTRAQTRRVLAGAGFSEVYSAPTSIFGKRLFTYMMANYAPDTFYALDHAAVPRVTDTALRGLGSHHIKVFERR
jgi:SAM-dependent methyltransferase